MSGVAWAGVVAASTVMAGGLYALLSSSSHPKASSQVEVWKKPEIGWVKLNVNGWRDHSGPSAGCGGVFRDASGAWLCGFALKLDPSCKAQETELRAILEGMQLASKMKFEKLIVESDNKEVVRMVVEDTLKFKKQSRPREYEIVKSIRDLLDDPKWQVELVSISRYANGVANRLVRKAWALSSNDLQEYLSPPDADINSFHLKDIG